MPRRARAGARPRRAAARPRHVQDGARGPVARDRSANRSAGARAGARPGRRLPASLPRGPATVGPRPWLHGADHGLQVRRRPAAFRRAAAAGGDRDRACAALRCRPRGSPTTARVWIGPSACRRRSRRNMTTTANLGVGLRWTAALAELRRFATVDRRLQEKFLDRFEREVRLRAGMTPRVALLGDGEHGIAPNPSIVPLAVRRADGGFMSLRRGGKGPGRLCARRLRSRMQGAAARLRRIIHVGQPVQLGPRAVLRVCASAPQINAVAAQVAQGAALRGCVRADQPRSAGPVREIGRCAQRGMRVTRRIHASTAALRMSDASAGDPVPPDARCRPWRTAIWTPTTGSASES